VGRRWGEETWKKQRSSLPPLEISMKPGGFGFGFRVLGFGFSGFGFRVSGFVFQVSCFVFRVSGFGLTAVGAKAGEVLEVLHARELRGVRLQPPPRALPCRCSSGYVPHQQDHHQVMNLGARNQKESSLLKTYWSDSTLSSR